jgi:hypothetical protein
MGPVVECIYRKMHSSHEDKSPLFPVPPRGSYWVKIELDWAKFAPVAAERNSASGISDPEVRLLRRSAPYRLCAVARQSIIIGTPSLPGFGGYWGRIVW